MASEATPRINAKYLEAFMNRTVRIVGKVTALHGETANLDAEGQDAHLKQNNAAEIVGKVQPDLSIKVFQASDWGSNFDYVAANSLVEVTHKYKEIFYEKASDDSLFV